MAPPGLGPGRLELGGAGRHDGDTNGVIVLTLAMCTGAVHELLPGASDRDTPNQGRRLWCRAQKNRRSPVGDERCQARGTTPLRGFLAEPAFVCTAMWLQSRCSGSITGADRSNWTTRRRLLGGSGDPAVRGGAPRSYRLAFPVPLHSYRGSLAHPRQGHVLIVASLFGCPPYRNNQVAGCQSLPRFQARPCVTAATQARSTSRGFPTPSAG